MFKKILIYGLIIFLLAACSKQDVVEDKSMPNISLQDVKNAIAEKELELKDADLPSGNIFIQKLNGVPPQIYFLDGSALSIYVFSDVDARKEAMDVFEEKSATASLEPYKTFTAQNVLVFYVEGSEENNNKLMNIIKSL
ncbi:hypothetical protein [Radiobacillus sp. PE A8.2]|uniref:hypothetical protein n=1 Tax=Radiobacillus sp. PE A8.2 TaxID=3380349 RepID=UPI00388F3565